MYIIRPCKMQNFENVHHIHKGFSMTLMQLIKTVLDDAYQMIDAPNDTAKDILIKEGIRNLGSDYAQLTGCGRTPIDYSRPETRFAYIYKYTVAHADYVRYIIAGSAEINNLLRQPKVEVACIGGGPGSDLLGILKYMLRTGISNTTLTCYIFDRERAWGDSWSHVAQRLDAPFALFPLFMQMDVTKEEEWASYRNYLNADLLTLSYFVSELWSIRKHAEPFFINFLSRMKPGGMLLFVDNNSAPFLQWFDEMIASNGFSVIESRGGELSFDHDEEKQDLGIYFTKFGWPKRASNAAWRILRKD